MLGVGEGLALINAHDERVQTVNQKMATGLFSLPAWVYCTADGSTGQLVGLLYS